MITIYKSDFVCNPGNCVFPHEVKITDIASAIEAFSKDYTCALFKNNYRSIENFILSNVVAVDCDNDHSEDPTEWVTAEDVIETFKNVKLVIHYSRNHMKDKNGKKARPRFHVLFEIDPIKDAKEYAEIKKRINSIFPYFDKNALDSARFFFGTPNPQVEFVNGKLTLSEYLFQDEFDACFDVIKDGTRNSTLSRFAGRIIKKFGDTEEAYERFLKEAEKCETPMEQSELEVIWNSARKFYNEKVLKDETYINPEEFNDETSYRPTDLTDVGQAEQLAKHFQNELRYSPATHFIKYRNNYWVESEPGAQAVVHELTRRQLREADATILKTHLMMEKTGVDVLVAGLSGKKIEAVLSKDQMKILRDYKDALNYRDFVESRRDSKYITATLKEVRPMIEIDTKELNSDAFLLNTPNATYDLRKGLAGARPHDPEDYITKITAVSPSEKGKDIWIDCLNKIFSSNQELIDYVQMICGLAAIGKVFIEAMIVAYGDGGNGKSTFWNAIFRVLGLYSGKISADALTVGCKRNIKPEMAELYGSRLIIASESSEGARLNDSVVKQLCSTDEVYAEKKYKDPFHFVPCHTLVLYTNHLPRVSGNDDGIWRRLIVIPFMNKFRGSSDIKNYADYLYENAGEYILAWIIEGAKKVIDLNYDIKTPKCVEKAIEEYRELNDWFHHFLDDCCIVDPSEKVSSNELYKAYRNYCIEINEFTRSTTDFYYALEHNGFKKLIQKRIKYVVGLKLKDSTSEFSDEPILTK